LATVGGRPDQPLEDRDPLIDVTERLVEPSQLVVHAVALGSELRAVSQELVALRDRGADETAGGLAGG
jgi:hypothetical protein